MHHHEHQPAATPVEPDRRPRRAISDQRQARTTHPAGRRRHLRVVPDLADEAGSLVAEYGLLVVLGATITMLATKWATGGAIWELFGAVLSRARALVGA